MFACNGILFNHESPRRGEHFVTRKITSAAARIQLRLDDCVSLGNLDAQRDWGHAQDYVLCMWLMLQQQRPDDFVIATGTTTTVRRFAELAFQAARMPLRHVHDSDNLQCLWTYELHRCVGSKAKDISSAQLLLTFTCFAGGRGSGLCECGIVCSGSRKGVTVVRVDPTYFRPTIVDILLGDASKAVKTLKWNPTATSLQVPCRQKITSLAHLASPPSLQTVVCRSSSRRWSKLICKMQGDHWVFRLQQHLGPASHA